MALRHFAFACLAVALVAPAASAHTAIYSADNKVRGSVGLLDEPVSTYAVTGLDVCFTQNLATSPRPAVDVGNAGNFTATLRAPNGDVHQQDLEIPFGKPNCLTFAAPLVLTQPGQYVVDLSGSINGTTFAVTGIAAGGQVIDRATITFPDASVPSTVELQARIAALEARLTGLETQETQTVAPEEGEFAPASPATLLMLGLAGFAAVLRRRQG